MDVTQSEEFRKALMYLAVEFPNGHAVIIRHLQGQSGSRGAKDLGIKKDAYYSRLIKAKGMLKERLQLHSTTRALAELFPRRS